MKPVRPLDFVRLDGLKTGAPLTLATLSLFLLTACEQNTFVPPPPPKVEVAVPVQKAITRYLDATGNTAAIKNVDLVARVQGFLQSINYQDGTFVKQGTTLFTIEPETYKLKLEQAQAAESGAQASLKQAEADFKRQSELVQRQAVSQATLDTSTSTRDNVQANLQQAQANTKIAQVNYGYTNVTAPFDGIVSAHLVSVGELVGVASPTQLATIVALDPIYVNFNVNEQDVLRIREDLRKRGMTVNEIRQLPIEIGLQTETGHPHKGKLDYVSPSINASTGTLAVRGIICQPRSRAAAGLLRSRPRALRRAEGRAVRPRHRIGQRPGRPLCPGRQRRQRRRAAQGTDRAARWRVARHRERPEGR